MEARFRAWMILGTWIARRAPERGLAVTNRSGAFQLDAWDVTSGELRQLTDCATRPLWGGLDPRGRFVTYLEDRVGNETGHIVRIPYAGGEPVDVTPKLEPYTLSGEAISADGSRAGFTTATRDGFQLYVADLDDDGDFAAAPRPLFHSRAMTQGPLLSQGGEVAVMATTERSASGDFNLVAIDVDSGERIGELFDEQASIIPCAFSRVAGDRRLLASSTRSGVRRPLIWDTRSGERTDLDVGALAGDLILSDWSLDGSRILLEQISQAVQRLFTYDLARDRLRPLDHPGGSIAYAYFVPDGEIFAQLEDSVQPTRVIALDPESGVELRTVLHGGEAPAGRRWESIAFTSTEGVTIQGWLGVPEGEGPFPTILETHGGPAAVMRELFSPRPNRGWTTASPS